MGVVRRGRAALVLGPILGLACLLVPSASGLAQETGSGGSGCLPAVTPKPGIEAASREIRDTTGQAITEVRAPVGGEPYGVAVDAGDAWARVYVTDRTSGVVSVHFGRSPDLRLACRLAVGDTPLGVAVDAATGQAIVALGGEERLAVIDGRRDEPRVWASIALPDRPGWVAIDPATRRVFVSLPASGSVAMLEPADDRPGVADEAPWRLATTFETGPFPFFLAVDEATGRLVVSNEGQAADETDDLGNGSVVVFDARAPIPERIGEAIPASVPAGIAFDPRTGNAYVLENGSDEVLTLAFPPGGGPPTSLGRDLGPYLDEGRNANPVQLGVLPATRELVVTLRPAVESPFGGHLDVLRLDEGGLPTWHRAVPAAERGGGLALDPVTGRILVAYVDEGVLAGLRLDEPTAPPPAPASVAEALPGPLEISLAPEDVARTVGLSLLILLIVGAPTPLFNETLESNLGVIQGWLGRLAPRRPRPEGDQEPGPGLAARASAFAASLPGLLTYLVIAAFLYAFLSPGFPGPDALLVFGVALLGITVATLADILPGRRWILRTYGDRGRVRVATWTLVLAAVCVAISKLGGLQPGFMYGIIGAFAFSVALSEADEGRAEARGALALLILALVAWFARIPFAPPPGVPASGLALVINWGLVGIFVVAVEGLVFGLVPIRFMPGHKIMAWSRWRWLVLWGSGVALFAHVLAYPVTVAQPAPDPATLATTLVAVTIYGSVAVGFWALFRRRERAAQREDPAAPA